MDKFGRFLMVYHDVDIESKGNSNSHYQYIDVCYWVIRNAFRVKKELRNKIHPTAR